MSFDDPFDPESPFFQDEFIFYDEKERASKSQRQPQHKEPNLDPNRLDKPCPDCGNTMYFAVGDKHVRCDHCETSFRLTYGR